MKKFILSLFTIFLIFGFSGCVSYAQYNVSLESVEVPKNNKQTFGKQVIVKSDEKGKTKYIFKDNMIEITWLVTSSNIYFNLKNKTNHSIKIIWDEAVFIDQDGQSHSVIHTGTKYSDRNNLKPPTIIARNAKVSDIIFPSDYVYSRSGQWKKLDLIKNYRTSSPKFAKDIPELAKKEINKIIQVLLPIKIEGIINEYIFVFRINDFKIVKD